MCAEKQKNVNERTREVDKNLHPWQWLSSLIAFVSLGLGVYCVILMVHLAPRIFACLSCNKMLQDDSWLIAGASSFVVMWWLVFRYMVSYYTWAYRRRNILHVIRWSPIVLFAVCLYACGFSCQTLLPYVIGGAVLAFIFGPAFLPEYKQQDIPFKPDVLGRRLLYEQLSLNIRKRLAQVQGRGITVAVTGTWGEGKSHLIHYVINELLRNQDGVRATEPWQRAFKYASVDVWKCDTVEAMWDEISESLASAIQERDVRLYKHWGRILVALLKVLHVPHAGLAEDVFRVLTTGVSGAGSVTESLGRQIQLQGQAYVLILDNLDRCGADKLQKLFPFIERLKNIPYLVTICGVAYGEMAEIGDEIAKILDDTFLKIFDEVIPMPQVAQEYRVPYMLYLAQQAGGGERLQKWCSTNRLSLHSPRIIENIMARLAFIDSHFVGRMQLSDEQDAVMQSGGVGLSFSDAIFFLEALRVVTPSIVVHMEKMENPKDALAELFEWHYNSKNVDEQSSENKSEFPAIWKPFEQKITQFSLVLELMDNLSKADKNVLKFALEQSYLAGSVLLDEECAECFEQFKKNENKIEFLKHHADERRILAYEKAAMFISLMRYAVRHADVSDTPDLAEKCRQLMETEEMRDSGMPLHYYGWVLQLLDAYCVAEDKQSSTSGTWKKMGARQLELLEIDLTQRLVKTLLEHRNDRFALEPIPDAPRLSEALLGAREGNGSQPLVDRVLHIVIKDYGRKVAERIVNGVKLDREKQCWIVGQDAPAKQYASHMKKGVEEYIRNTLSLSLQDVDERTKIRQNLLAALRIEMWKEDYTGIIPKSFTVLSFAVVWGALCRVVFGEGSLSVSERNTILAELHELKLVSRKEINASADFQNNRKIAIRILISSLEKIIHIK
ncbi:MAG: KAP family NTPase [Akkermansia sp.]|nr:KAP family NTPase [Akkermansia sp.]